MTRDEAKPITKITRKYCVQDESGYTDEELVGKVNEIIDYINKEPRQDLQQAAERIIEEQNKWFEEQERKEQEPAYCDRNICLKNEYNGIGCEECEVTKSQEPSGDVISRQDAYKCLEIHGDYNTLNEVYERLEKLPSVNPTGHWISHYDEDAKEGWYECDRCHTERAFNTDFCPDCGARMVEPQESEVSNG